MKSFFRPDNNGTVESRNRRQTILTTTSSPEQDEDQPATTTVQTGKEYSDKKKIFPWGVFKKFSSIRIVVRQL